MRAMSSLLLAGFTVSLFITTPACAQYYNNAPQQPEVEVDLSVLDDPALAPVSSAPTQTVPSYTAPAQPQNVQPLRPPVSTSEFPPPITAAVPTTPVERAPLPPVASPYENSRVVNRVEPEGSNPYLGETAPPSPFNPPALLKPPQPQQAAETPRTAPARVFKASPQPAVEDIAPIVVEGEPELMNPEGVDMPAINVTNAIRDQAPRTAPVAVRKTVYVQKPVRKPAVLSLASEAPAQREETASVAQQELSPVTTAAEMPVIKAADLPTPPPEVKKTAEAVIEDLYTLSPHQGAAATENNDTTMMTLSADETAPPPAMPESPVAENLTGSLSFSANDVALDDRMHQEVDRVATLLDDSENSRLLIKGYASGTDGNRASARRLSVSRALAVRAYLMDKGIKPSRVDVRGMGSDSTDQSASLDRVDLMLIP